MEYLLSMHFKIQSQRLLKSSIETTLKDIKSRARAHALFSTDEDYKAVKKILFVAGGVLDHDNYPNPNKGGPVQTWGLSKELAKRGYDVYIVRCSLTGGEERVDNVNLINIRFRLKSDLGKGILYQSNQILSSIIFSMKSVKNIRKVNPDVINIINLFSGFFPSELNIPKVYILHSADSLCFFYKHSIAASKLNYLLFWIKNKLDARIMQHSDAVVVLNRYIKKHLVDKGFRNVVRIPNAVNIEDFSYNGDHEFILYAGKFDNNKRVDLLVNQFAEICRAFPDFSLYLIGSGPKEKELINLIKLRELQNRATIIPWLSRKELIDMMSKCSVFVLPSLFETFSVVILEAMASGKPVIARATPGPSDIITHGRDGFLFRDNAELKRYLGLLLSDYNLRKRIGFNARKTVEEKFTFKKIAGIYEKLYDCLIAK